MADERPAAYREEASAGGSLLVVRASALGSCLWELIATLQDHEPQPWPDRLLRAFKEGEEAEPEILARLEAIGWVLDPSGAQRECDLKVGGGRVVRCHPDAAGCPASQPTTPHVVEAKALHNSTWQSIRRHGLKTPEATRKSLGTLAEHYAWQFTVEMLVTGMPLAVVVLNKGETPDENGKRPECADQGQLHVEFVTEPPYTRAEVIRRVKEIADVADGEDITYTGRPCDNPSQWPCRFLHLRPEPEKDKGWAIDAAEVDEFEKAAKRYRRGKRLEDQAAKIIAESKVELLRLGGEHERVFTDRCEVAYVGGETTVTDWAAMKADGVKVEKYQSKKSRAKSVRVTVR